MATTDCYWLYLVETTQYHCKIIFLVYTIFSVAMPGAVQSEISWRWIVTIYSSSSSKGHRRDWGMDYTIINNINIMINSWRPELYTMVAMKVVIVVSCGTGGRIMNPTAVYTPTAGAHGAPINRRMVEYTKCYRCLGRYALKEGSQNTNFSSKKVSKTIPSPKCVPGTFLFFWIKPKPK